MGVIHNSTALFPNQLVNMMQGNLLDDYLLKAQKPKIQDASTPPAPLEGGEAEKPDGMREGQRMATDWKGDPMIINPGDNMPMF